jgi:hypothetical protein
MKEVENSRFERRYPRHVDGVTLLHRQHIRKILKFISAD